MPNPAPSSRRAAPGRGRCAALANPATRRPLAQDARLEEIVAQRPAAVHLMVWASRRDRRFAVSGDRAIDEAAGHPDELPRASYDSIDQVIERPDLLEPGTQHTQFQADGLVVKVDDLKQHERLGARSKSPRWTIAFKYEAGQGDRAVVGIPEVGKTEDLRNEGSSPCKLQRDDRRLAPTPTARAQDIMVGDAVVVQKASEIIHRSSGWRPTRAGTARPVPDSPRPARALGRFVERSGDEVAYYCTNPPSRLFPTAQGAGCGAVRPSRCDG